jgi:3-oxoacyl-[acyl-carrier-protein] synthase III
MGEEAQEKAKKEKEVKRRIQGNRRRRIAEVGEDHLPLCEPASDRVSKSDASMPKTAKAFLS